MEPIPQISATSEHELAANYQTECWSQANKENPERMA